MSEEFNTELLTPEQRQQLAAAEKEREAAEAAAEAAARELKLQQREAEVIKEKARTLAAQEIISKELEALGMESAAPLPALLKLLRTEAGFEVSIADDGAISVAIDGESVSLGRALMTFAKRNGMLFALKPDGSGVKKRELPTKEKLQKMSSGEKAEFITRYGGQTYQEIIAGRGNVCTDPNRMTASDWGQLSLPEKSEVLHKVGRGADAWLDKLLRKAPYDPTAPKDYRK